MYPIKFQSLVLGLFSVLVLTSCSGGGGSSGGSGTVFEDTSVVLEDFNATFSSIGISSVQELQSKISSVGALALSVEIQNANPQISTEEISKLLRVNNNKIEYKKLEDAAVATEVIDKLKALRYSPVLVEQMIALPDSKIFPVKNISTQALDLLNQEKLKSFNKKLRLAAQEPLSMEAFLSLQSAFEKVEMVNNFGNLDQRYQNILARDTIGTSSAPSQSASRVSALVPDGYVLVNADKELRPDGIVSDFPFMDNSCQISRVHFPMTIAKEQSSVNTTLVTSEGGDVKVQFPQTGIAVIVVSGRSDQRIIIKNSESAELDNRLIGETYTYYIPITGADVCKPFVFEGADAQFSITLTDIIQPQRVAQHIFLNGTEFLSTGSDELYRNNTLFHAKSYTFSTIHSQLSDLNITFDIDTDNDTEAYFNYVLYAPGGSVFWGKSGGSLGALQMDGVTREKGIWRLDILPKDAVSFSATDAGTLSGLAPTSITQGGETYLNLATYINTDQQIQTKEFVLGILKSVSLKTEGEDGAFNEGEVSINLNTNMAPPINIPSYIDDLIKSTDTMSNEIALWQCWINSQKTGDEFKTDGACYSYNDEFLRRKQLYESAHSYDYQNDPQTYICPDEDGMQDTCIKGELGPYNIANPTESYKAHMVMTDYSKYMQRQYQDVEYLHILSNYYDLYQNWIERTVQVDVGQFPYNGLAYKTQEFMECNSTNTGCIDTFLNTGEYPRIPVIIETNRPVLGVPVERVNKSTLPITFDYVASDQDVYNANAELLPVLSYAASQALNIVTGNFIDLVCDTVTLADELHDVELAAQDDPLGSARAAINRFSSTDPFYGLHTQDAYHFYMSGVAQKNTDIDTYGQKLSYAKIACGLADISNGGMQFFQTADLVLNMDKEQLPGEQDVYNVLTGSSSDSNTSTVMREAQEIAALIQAGKIDEAKERLRTGSDISKLNGGVDLYSDVEELLNNYKNEGSAQNGNNVLKSDAQYLFGVGKKTRGAMEFARVSSAPVASVKVSLNNVKIISNYESDDNAEIHLIPFVGVIGDAPRTSNQIRSLFSDTEVIGDASGQDWDYLYFTGVADNEELDTNDALLYSGGSENIAALYIELAIVEDDGISKEDDDMIGVFSQTLKLEEIFNKNAAFEWTHLDENKYQLVISDYPVYNSSNQLALENPLSSDFEQQKLHNQKREPSALVSITVDVVLDESINSSVALVDTSLDVAVMASGRDVLSMEMRVMNQLESDTNFRKIIDIFDSKAIVSSNIYDTLPATVLEVDPVTSTMRELFSYDINDFNGTLLPIKEAMTASKSIGRSMFSTGQKELSLVRLLADNRMLFVFSHDSGARVMTVRYTDEGVMSLESSIEIKDESNQTVFTTIRSFLSPKRTQLIVPYIPLDYASTDKHEPVHTKLNLYTISDTNLTLLSHPNIGTQTVFQDLEFIDESHLAVLTQNLLFETESSYRADWKEIQNSCTSEKMDCLFGVKSGNLLLFTINGQNRIELSDSQDISYSVPYTLYYNENSPLKTLAYRYDKKMNLVSHVDGFYANLRLGLKLQQLNYDAPTDAYYVGTSTANGANKSLRYNPIGAYYCANGITCSGFLSTAAHPTRDDENIFQYKDAAMNIQKFEFLDTDRDLVLALVNSGQPVLLSLYDGIAYKGPQISGDIFDTNIRVGGADQVAISFSLTDRDTPIDTLTIQVSISTIEGPLGYEGTHISNISCSLDENNISQCSGTISVDAFESADITLDQKIIISVSDGVYTAKGEFGIYHRPSILLPFTDTVHAVEAWMSDASEAGTMMLNDANPSGSSLYLGTPMHKFAQKYIYAGETESGDREPFVAGVGEQAHQIDSTKSIGFPSDFVTLGENVYFIAHAGGGSTYYNYHLWRTDGTPEGTLLVKDMSGFMKITSLVLLNDTLYFIADKDSTSNNSELWVSDGTQEGTKLLKNGLEIFTLFTGAQKVFFNNHDSTNAQDGLWSSDGTQSGTQFLKQLSLNMNQMITYKDAVYFQYRYAGDASVGYNDVTELWKTDGTPGGTVLAHSFGAKQYAQDINGYFTCDDKFYFLYFDALWESDGSDAGTAKVVDYYTLPNFSQLNLGSIPSSIRVVDNTIYMLTRHYDSALGEVYYKVYTIHPSSSSILQETDTARYSYAIFYNEAIQNDFFYYAADATSNYLYIHNKDDGLRLVKKTSK